MTRVRKAYAALRSLGPRFAWTRARVELDQALGRTRRRFSKRPWHGIALGDILRPGAPADDDGYAALKRDAPPAFLFPLGCPPPLPPQIVAAPRNRRPALVDRLRLIEEGRCVYFTRTPSPARVLDNWHANPFTGRLAGSGRAWCDIPDFDPRQGDVRMLWEPARAAWAIDLARARARGATADVAREYWRWVDSWMAACPPFDGIHWKCGQESSIRFLALVFAHWALAGDPLTTPSRWVQMARLAWATGFRVRHHIRYAVSQTNNHALSEACGLIVVATLFPELREAEEWLAVGRRVLTEQMRRQFYADGSYVQHSMSYQRVAVQVCTLALRLCELAGRPLERDLYEAIGRSADFLHQMTDEADGRTPRYGHDDGALVLPLSECDAADFRPAIQSAHYLARRKRLYPAGAWDEEVFWLFGPEVHRAPVVETRRCSRAFEAGGYYTIRGEESWAMIRCASYRDRPAQCDPLHVDLWWRGVNVLRDCGTYLYYVPERPDLEHYFKSIAAHNTVQIDDAEPMELISRFLWYPWLRSDRLAFESARAAPSRDRQGAGSFFAGQHYGYQRSPWSVLHRRALIHFTDDAWAVVDDLFGPGEHAATLRWHLCDAPCEVAWAAPVEPGAAGPRVQALTEARPQVELGTPAGEVHLTIRGDPFDAHALEVVRGRDAPGRVLGFAADTYGERTPIPTVEARFRGRLPLRIITVIGLGAPVRVQRDAGPRWVLRTAVGEWTLAARPAAAFSPAGLFGDAGPVEATTCT